MGSQEMFSGTVSLLEKALDIRSMKHNLIISNVANKDTPNYKAFDLAVEEEMQKLRGTADTVTLRKTQKGHLPSKKESCPEISIARTSKGYEQNIDGNTVDIEREMTNLAENNLLYDAMAQIMRKKLQGLKVAIQGGSK